MGAIRKPVNEKSKKSQEHKRNQCDFKGKSTVTLKNHLNTKSYLNETNDKVNLKDVKCSLCEDKFNSKHRFMNT
jgi:hypothetical protein